MRSRFAVAACIAGALLASSSALVCAQARAGDDSATASPLNPTYERIGDALARSVIGRDDAASHWISGRLSAFEPAARIADFAAAAAREPREPLYVASLADACMQPFSRPPAECADRDWIGYWTSRDSDNAVPWLLQAERARRRNNVASMIDNLERAARAARYDDYAGRGGQLMASHVVPRTDAAERAAALLYSLRQGATPLGAPLAALESSCAPATRALDERVARQCVRLGALMSQRASSFANRRAGAQIARSSTGTDSARGLIDAAARSVVQGQDQCREALGTLERMALGAPAERERAAALAERHLVERAARGEIEACEALVKSAPAAR